MGITDQRGEWRRVVTDGQRQAQVQSEDERSIPAEAWESNAAGEPRGIRLLADSGPGRTPVRAVAAQGRPEAENQDHGPASDPGEAALGEPSGVDRARRLRSDESQAPQPTRAHALDGRTPGPLRARIAQRHRRGTIGLDA